MTRKLLLSLSVLIAIAAIGGFLLLPASAHIARSRTVAAPAEVVFVNVNDFHAWPGWAPWEKERQTVKRTFDGPNNGLNSVYGWTGNPQFNDGRMVMTCSELPSRICVVVEHDLAACAPRQMTFRFDRLPGATKVSWSIDEPLRPVDRIKSLLGARTACPAIDLEAGLAALDQVAIAHVKAVAAAASAPLR